MLSELLRIYTLHYGFTVWIVLKIIDLSRTMNAQPIIIQFNKTTINKLKTHIETIKIVYNFIVYKEAYVCWPDMYLSVQHLIVCPSVHNVQVTVTTTSSAIGETSQINRKGKEREKWDRRIWREKLQRYDCGNQSTLPKTVTQFIIGKLRYCHGNS